jgi:hypothetical protein
MIGVATFALLWHEVRLRRFERRESQIAQARSIITVLDDTEDLAEGRDRCGGSCTARRRGWSGSPSNPDIISGILIV